jgi:hemerythrin-like metal-binding protein
LIYQIFYDIINAENLYFATVVILKDEKNKIQKRKEKNMITLSKDMETGITKVDEQHKELINRINTVTSMGRESTSTEETQKTLDLLTEYVFKHFGDEEIIQRQYNYPKHNWHKEQHQIFINSLRGIEKEFAANGASPKFTLDLSKHIIKWIVVHIKNADVEFGKYYKSQI